MRNCLCIVLSLINIVCFANILTFDDQTYKRKVISSKGEALDAVNVVLSDENNNTVAFGFTAQDGFFEVKTDGRKANTISFSLIGYAKYTVKTTDFKNGQIIELEPKSFQLKEVTVRPDKVIQRGDTLNYNVSQFMQNQDRSIADVIKKMPGLEVSASGQISFEGKPINKFYIEGMDLMGGKYSQASENLQARNVKKVQVVQNHQPIKSLRGVQFSEQAALNIVLKDDVKNTWTGLADIGLGTQLQDRHDALYDGKLMAMLFSKKMQNISMYKANNNGKDIAHEVKDLASQLCNNNEQQPLLVNNSIKTPGLDKEQTYFNTSHLIATNQLFRTKLGNDVRVQVDYLWNRECADVFAITRYTDVWGLIVSEEYLGTAINHRVKGDITYKVNKDKTYLNNRLYAYVDFDKSYGSTLLNGNNTRQLVRPKKSYITEDLELIKTTSKGYSYTISSTSTLSYLPGRLLTVVGNTEKLDIKTFASSNSISFRQRLKYFAINYKAGADILCQQMDVAYSDINSQDNYNRYDFYITPSVNCERQSLRLNVSAKASLAASNYDNNTNSEAVANRERSNNVRFTLQPQILLKYDVSATTSATVSYNYIDLPNTLLAIYRTPVFTSYRTQVSFSGKAEDRGLHSARISLAYKQPIKGNFVNASATWMRRINEMLFESNVKDNVCVLLQISVIMQTIITFELQPRMLSIGGKQVLA